MINKLKSPRLLTLLILGIIYLIVMPVVLKGSPYILNILITASIFSIAALWVWLCFTAGLIHIGQGVFMAIGGYTTAILSLRLGISFWLCLPIAGLMAVVVGLGIGSVTRWLKGLYFAMFTFVLNEVMRLGMTAGGDFTGGSEGLTNIARPNSISIGGWTIIPQFTAADKLPYYFLAAFLLIISVAVVWRLSRCQIGKCNSALLQSDKLAAAVGISIVKYRLIAIGVSSFLAGIGGAFVVSFTTTILPQVYTLWVSIYLLIYCLFGGLGYIAGPISSKFYSHLSQQYMSIRQLSMLP